MCIIICIFFHQNTFLFVFFFINFVFLFFYNSTYRISPSICRSPLSINLKNATSPLIDDKNREVIEGMIPPLRPDEFPVRTPNDFEVTSINL